MTSAERLAEALTLDSAYFYVLGNNRVLITYGDGSRVVLDTNSLQGVGLAPQVHPTYYPDVLYLEAK